MAPRKISAKEVIIDIRTGLSNDEIGKKYGLSQKGTKSLLDKLLDLNLLKREEYYQRLTSSVQSIDLRGDNGGSALPKESITGQSESPLPPIYFLGKLEDNVTGPHGESIGDNDSAHPARRPSPIPQGTQEDRMPGATEFIDISTQGKNQWWRYLVSILFILIFFFTMSVIVGAVLGTTANLDKATGTFTGMSLMRNYLLLHLGFLFIFVALLLAVRYEHKRPILSLITPNRSIDWKKLGKSFGVFWALLSCVLLVDYVTAPADFQFYTDLGSFLSFAPVVLVLTPIQITTEELFFRGYLLQMMALLTRNRVVLVFISGLLFMLPHLANPEVASGFFEMALYYFIVGGFLTLVTLKSNGLEVAIGIHGATNLFGALIVNYANSVLKTESILFCSTFSPVGSLVSFSVMAIVFYLVMFGGRLTKQKPWIIWGSRF